MRVLVTGGAGYIGTHIVRFLLEKGHDPIIIDNQSSGKKNFLRKILKAPLIMGNVGDKDLMLEILEGTHISLKNTIHYGNMVEAVIHLASHSSVEESIKNPLKYYSNNVSESISLFEVITSERIRTKRLDKKPIPIVFSSTCATYGIPEKIPISENEIQRPINPYGESKLMIEKIIKDLSTATGMRSVILRYFNAAGASEDNLLGDFRTNDKHLIPLAIRSILSDDIELKIFGDDYPTKDGTCIRDYIHVCDIAEAHEKVLSLFKSNLEDSNVSEFEEDFCRAYNLGIGRGFSVKEIITNIEEISKKKLSPCIAARRKGDPPILISSPSKIQKELGWSPKYLDIKDIISHTYNWLRKIN